MSKVYIAGPMTGLPEFNYPAFNEAAKAWRGAHYRVSNPAEIDGGSAGKPWDFYMRNALSMVVECDAVALLPGWEKSKGATLEVTIARALNMKFYDALTFEPVVPGYDHEKLAPQSWDEFLADATASFVKKNTDYNSRFMKALVNYAADHSMEASRTIWAWEVEKKLDRLRSYLDRGTLLVEGEGVANSVQDLFIYTVQWQIFVGGIKNGTDVYAALTESNFFKVAAGYCPVDWVQYLGEEGLIAPSELNLMVLIRDYMTGRKFYGSPTK